jgi:hypothetical protein
LEELPWLWLILYPEEVAQAGIIKALILKVYIKTFNGH